MRTIFGFDEYIYNFLKDETLKMNNIKSERYLTETITNLDLKNVLYFTYENWTNSMEINL